MKLKHYLSLTVVILVNHLLVAQTFELDGIAYNITSDIEPYAVEVTNKDPNYEGDITIPEEVVYEENAYTVTSIGNNAFQNADNLTSVVMPNSITLISDFGFFSCDDLNSVTFSTSLITIGPSAFHFCSSISEFVLPNTLDSICERGFASCQGFTNFNIPESIKFIGNAAFSGCSNLTSITIPYLVDSLGNGLFSYCNNLDSIFVHESNPYFSSVEGVLFNNDTTSLLEFPMARSGQYFIPNKVRIIKAEAFKVCIGLEYIRLSDSLEFIGSEAFFCCQNLDSIYIPKNVETIGFEAFAGNISLKKIVVDELNLYYSSLEGVLFNKDQSQLIRYPGGITGSYVVPNTVNRLNDKAFSFHEHITSVEIPGFINYIGVSCFDNCHILSDIDLGFGVDSICSRAFSQCTLLDSIIIPNSVLHLGTFALSNCENLKMCQLSDSLTIISYGLLQSCVSLDSITIPNRVNTISTSALSNCVSLRDIRMGNNISYIESHAFEGLIGLNSFTCCTMEVPELSCYVFYNTPYGIPLYVPTISVEDYQSAIQWCNFNVIGTDDCSIVSNVKTINQMSGLYPNPFKEVIKIENYGGSTGQLELFNLYGNLVLSTEINQSSVIMVENLSSGIYLYKIVFKDGSISAGKIIKNKY